MRLQPRVPALLLACVFACIAADDLPPAPQTPKKPVTDDYQGVQVVDDYRWLEPAADPEVRKWSDQQNARTRTYLDGLANRPAIVERLHQLNGSSSVKFSSLVSRAGLLFALKTQPPKTQAYLVSLTSPDDPASARTIVDPNTIDPTGSTTIDFYEPSLDGKLVAVSLSKGGSEEGSVSVFEVVTGKQLGDAIPRVNGATAGGSVAWNRDASGFWYTHYPRAGERAAADLNFYQQIYFHRMGVPATQDEYANGKQFPRIAEVELQSSDDGRFILATVENGDGGEYLHHMLLPDGQWHQITRFL
jgi:prolyl oligopeptidase